MSVQTRSRGFFHYIRAHIFQIEIIGIVLIILASTVGFKRVEGLSRFDALYFSLITLASVGYGDITPHTDIGKVIAMVLAGIGLPLYILTTSIIATRFLETLKKNARTQQKSVTSTVKGLIVYQGKLLFIKQKVGSVDLWDLPGGRVRYGEDPIAALKRHMIEEIGIGGVIRHSLGIRQRYHTITKEYTLCHTYVCSITDYEYEQLCTFSTFKEQISEIAWVTIDAIKDQTFDIGNNSLRSLFLANIRTLMERDDGLSPTQTN